MGDTASKEKKTNRKGFFAGVRAEFGKIVWPTREDVGRETVAVLVCSVVLSLIIAVLDLIISYGLSFVL